MNVHMLRVVKLNYKPGFKSHWHTHNYFHCILTISGTGLVKVSDVEHFVNKNDLILVPPRTFHLIATVEKLPFKTIEAKFSIPDDLLMSQVNSLPVHMAVDGQWMRRPMEQILKEGIEKPVFYNYMINNKMAEVLLTLLRAHHGGGWKHKSEEGVEAAGADRSNMSAVVSYINANIQESITVDDLAAVAMLSKSYFCTLFKDRFGISPNQYIIKTKLDKAKEIMLYSDMNVSQIADSLGFASLHYFSKLFKKKEGIAPHEYIERMAENIEIDLAPHD